MNPILFSTNDKMEFAYKEKQPSFKCSTTFYSVFMVVISLHCEEPQSCRIRPYANKD